MDWQRHKMTKYKEAIYDGLTKNITVREFTNEETIAKDEADAAYSLLQEAKLAEAEAKAAAKAALLEKLGISEDEARLLLA